MIKIQKENFNVSSELSIFSEKNKYSGAISTFLGKVRKDSVFGNVKSIYIEHYEKMTRIQLLKCIKKAKEKWGINDLLIIHRFGQIKIGENIVLILTASDHRKDSIESLEYIIDWLKVKATFWKKEKTTNGDFWLSQKSEDIKRSKKYLD
tara:strand:- start:289 stop:738 length:450 start_codon:yes stop_codon:yes gene_type:complete